MILHSDATEPGDTSAGTELNADTAGQSRVAGVHGQRG